MNEIQLEVADALFCYETWKEDMHFAEWKNLCYMNSEEKRAFVGYRITDKNKNYILYANEVSESAVIWNFLEDEVSKEKNQDNSFIYLWIHIQNRKWKAKAEKNKWKMLREVVYLPCGKDISEAQNYPLEKEDPLYSLFQTEREIESLTCLKSRQIQKIKKFQRQEWKGFVLQDFKNTKANYELFSKGYALYLVE